MASEEAKAPSDFLTIARKLGVLSAEVANRLADEATALNVSPEQLALKQGLMSTVQMDMVQTLQNPLDTIPGYEIQRVLGQGGMGVVYSARQTNLQRDVALKTVLVSMMSDAQAIARFQQEAVAVARLRHPNIIAAYDFGRHAGRLFFVMELVDGQDLNYLIQFKGSLEEFQAWNLARQVVSGLAHAAQLGIVHRDIKPANLLLVSPPTGFSLPQGVPMVKIADFGLASLGTDENALTRLTAANTMLGSPQYMAPEQMSDSSVDFRADIYALGITVYHMLSGSPPFTGHVSQVLTQKLQGKIPDLRTRAPNTSQASVDLIAAMTQTERTNRPQSYEEILNRIDSILKQKLATSTNLPPSSITPLLVPDDATREMAGSTTLVTANRPPGWRSWLITTSVVLMILLTGVFVAKQRQKSPPRSGPRLIATGWRQYLFQGTLRDWFVISGQWGDALDDDGAKVLSGNDGRIRRELLKPSDTTRKPLDNYRISLGVCLHQASAVEMQFGIVATDHVDAPRSYCRIQSDGKISLGSRTSDTSAPPSPVHQRTIPVDRERYHAVVLEHCNHAWRVAFDGQFLGELPVNTATYRPEFRLAVDGGPAWFSDLEVEELKME